jgi:hypothetical protein
MIPSPGPRGESIEEVEARNVPRMGLAAGQDR